MHRAFGGDRPAPPAEGYVSISLTAPEASQRLLRECATSRMVHVTRLLAIEGIDVNVKDARGRPAARGASRQVKPANGILRLPAVTFPALDE